MIFRLLTLNFRIRVLYIDTRAMRERESMQNERKNKPKIVILKMYFCRLNL